MRREYVYSRELQVYFALLLKLNFLLSRDIEGFGLNPAKVLAKRFFINKSSNELFREATFNEC